MTAVPLLCLVAVASYLVGAIPFGYVIARWRGHDILREGSGNIGTTNVARVVGFRFGLLVFVLDFTKGALPTYLAWLLPPPSDLEQANVLPVVAGVLAFLGHLFPVYLRFRGGKGVATGLGVIAVLLPVIALVVLAAWGVVLAITRYVSLASIAAAALLFALRLWWEPTPWDQANVVVTGFCAVGALLIVVRHHSNIRRLLQGTEPRLGSEVPPCSPS
jgi:glycerol-3-phosphate acyltransferase PlsY